MIQFGTDGWRAIIAEEFTFANVTQVAQAHAQAILKKGGSRVVIGYDTRFASNRFAALVAQIMSSNGIKTFLSHDYLPTPALSFAVLRYQADAGVMITASHNPAEYNGYKVKGAYGGSATPELVKAIEQELVQLKEVPVSSTAAIEFFDIKAAYLEQLERLAPLPEVRTYEADFYHHSMGGAGSNWLRPLFQKPLWCSHFRAVYGMPSPSFYGLNPEPIAANLYDFGAYFDSQHINTFVAVTDGDADRIGVLLSDGTYFNSHQIYAILLAHLHRKGLRGKVVYTVSTSKMIERLAQNRGLATIETPIGFKYITQAFLSDSVLMGGEESGGFAIQGHIPERDGLLTALLLLNTIAETGQSLQQQFQALEAETQLKHAYERIDLHLDANSNPKAIFELLKDKTSFAGKRIAKIQTLDGLKFHFEDDSWLLFRASGTEPVLRLYCEASSQDEVQRLLQAAQQTAQQTSHELTPV